MPKEGEIKVTNFAPGNGITGAAFGNQAVDMRVPFEVAAEGVKDTDKARGKKLGAV